jgi:UDP-glucose 4-epimerase
MKRVGVTGAAGFIGSHMCSRLLDEGVEVVGVDDLSMGSVTNIAPCVERDGFTFEVLDATHRRELRAAFDGCDAIVHLAAAKIPRYGGALRMLEGNVASANAACAVALALDADIILASTSDVYGNAPTPFREDGPIVLGPPTTRRWAYAASKLYDEHVVLALGEERGLRATILRLFNVYGPNNHLSWWGGPVVTFYEALLAGQPIEIHGDGRQTRTFTYVEDTVEAFVLALRAEKARGEVINVGASSPVSILELAELIQATLGVPQPLRARLVPYETLPGRYQDVRHRVPDVSKAERLLGFRAKVLLADGLERSLEWHQSLLDRQEVAQA